MPGKKSLLHLRLAPQFPAEKHCRKLRWKCLLISFLRVMSPIMIHSRNRHWSICRWMNFRIGFGNLVPRPSIIFFDCRVDGVCNHGTRQTTGGYGALVWFFLKSSDEGCSSTVDCFLRLSS